MSITAPNGSDDRDEPLLSVRTTLVRPLAGLSAAGVVTLLALARRSPVEIALVSIATAAAAPVLIH